MDTVVAQKVSQFFGQFSVRSHRKGQILIYANDDPTAIYHLLEGRVKQYDISYRGDEVVLNVFKPPAFFPMSYAINRTPNLYFYEAETDIKFHAAPIDEVVAFVKGNPDVLYNLLGRVYRGADGLLGRLTHMMAGTARSRVLYELLIQTRRFGRKSDSATMIPATETDIAAQAGLARETVSREIAKLKHEGVIIVRRQVIGIVDADNLAEIIGREI